MTEMSKQSASAQPKQPFPPQEQAQQPGRQREMTPAPLSIADDYAAAGKLRGKVALISGGDSGIGRAVALHFAREGASVAIIYRNEHDDARDTVNALRLVGLAGGQKRSVCLKR